MVTKEQFLNAIDIVKEYKKQCQQEIKTINEILKTANAKLKMSSESDPYINETDMSVRLLNLIACHYDSYNIKNESSGFGKKIRVSELSKIPLYDLLVWRGCGEAMVQEFQRICNMYNVKINTGYETTSTI